MNFYEPTSFDETEKNIQTYISVEWSPRSLKLSILTKFMTYHLEVYVEYVYIVYIYTHMYGGAVTQRKIIPRPTPWAGEGLPAALGHVHCGCDKM